MRSGSLRNSNLFLGPVHVGKTTLALDLAAMIVCRAPDLADRPCGQCSDCQRVARGTHEDVVVIPPAGASFTIEQVREVESDLPLSPSSAAAKVRILTDFGTATREAQNAILKTLEEPPSHAYLILTATTRQQLLPTIVSRCQTLSLRPVTALELARGLVQRGLPEEEAHRLALESGGRPGWAIASLEDEKLRRRRTAHLARAAAATGWRRWERIREAEAWGKSPRDEVLSQLDLWEMWWHDQLLAQAHATDGYALAPAQRPAYLPGLSIQAAGQAIRDVSAISADIRRNANLRLALAVLLVRLPYLLTHPLHSEGR